ncbi:hypothetical protein [Cryobacterium sp. PH29-G1]|nr:hypothetical protein [Cryobacterium sp. PH29-G1]
MAGSTRSRPFLRLDADAAADEEAGTDTPPAWTEQPTTSHPDQEAND